MARLVLDSEICRHHSSSYREIYNLLERKIQSLISKNTPHNHENSNPQSSAERVFFVSFLRLQALKSPPDYTKFARGLSRTELEESPCRRQ